MTNSAPGHGHRETIHEEAERIAVPRVDWVMVPVDAIFDGLVALVTHHGHGHRPPTGGDGTSDKA